MKIEDISNMKRLSVLITGGKDVIIICLNIYI